MKAEKGRRERRMRGYKKQQEKWERKEEEKKEKRPRWKKLRKKNHWRWGLLHVHSKLKQTDSF